MLTVFELGVNKMIHLLSLKYNAFEIHPCFCVYEHLIPSYCYILLLLRIAEREGEREREKEKEILHPLIPSLGGHNGQCWDNL